ncbi:MAG: dUTP diphosphatase [Patescibacteria group bacterium]|jgi:dUTP pyrophosphatase
MNNYPGKLIVLYGINNLGKSTQAKLLVERLKANGYQSEYLKYAIYSIPPSGEILNGYLRDGNPYDLSPRESQIIQALNRTQYQAELIAKLKAGINVVAEDYKGTGIAWGLGAGVDENFLKKINSHLVDEDLVFLFDGERFRQAIENNHKHENDDDLMNKVRWAHLKLREEYGWRKIDANRPIEEIHEEIWGQAKRLLEGTPEEAAATGVPPREKYNYSGFQTIGHILTDGGKTVLTASAAPVPTDRAAVLKPEPNAKIELPRLIKDEQPSLLVEKINPQAKLPTRAHAGDAGYDLYANDYYSITPYGQALVATGIKLAIPEGHVGLIWDKSGLASEGIKTMGGVIDSGYRGEIKVVVKNLNELDFNIVPGQKIAQIIIQEYKNFPLKEELLDGETSRADGGFGSSGKF